MKKNIILTDFICHDEDFSFIQSLNRYDSTSWKSVGCNASGKEGGKSGKIYKWLIPVLRVFLKRSSYNDILAWQQFMGLLLSAICRILNVKKTFNIYIMTFIYRARTGIKGKIFFNFIKYAVDSKYVDKIFVFSEIEVKNYSNIFKRSANKFTYIPLGIDKINNLHPVKQTDFILAAGRSNRDFNFLIESLADTDYKILILSDIVNPDKSTSNIEIRNDIFTPEMFSYLKACKCVLIPLYDPKISAGQLFFLQAMQLGKPIIITESDSITTYIKDGHNGLIIKKEKEALLNSLNRLFSDIELYECLSTNGKNDYEKFYTMDCMAKNIIQYIKK